MKVCLYFSPSLPVDSMRQFLCVHHTADQSPTSQYQKTYAYHDSGADGRFPPDHGIQYHFLIEKSGAAIQGPPLDKVLWHADSIEWNEKAMAVCLAGDFTFQTPTEEQLSALYSCWKNLQFPHVVYHKEVRPEPTQCPGTFLFREELERRHKLDLLQQLKNAEHAFPRLQGTVRGSMLARLIQRLKSILIP